MSTIHMQTEEVRRLSRRTCLEAESFLDKTHELESKIRSMKWEGGSSSDFRSEISVLITGSPNDVGVVKVVEGLPEPAWLARTDNGNLVAYTICGKSYSVHYDAKANRYGVIA